MKIYAQELLDKHKEDWGEFEPAGIDAPELKELFTESDKYHDVVDQSERSKQMNREQQDILGQMRWSLDFLKDGQPAETVKDLTSALKKTKALVDRVNSSAVSDEELRAVFVKYLQNNMSYVSDTLIPMINEKKIPEAIHVLERLIPNYFYSTLEPLVAKKLYAKRIYARKLLADDTMNVDKSEGWSEFEPQFKTLIPEEGQPAQSPESAALQQKQREIVDIIGEASDLITQAKFESVAVELRKIKGLTYTFLNDVQHANIKNPEEKKALIENALEGVDQVEAIIGELDSLRKGQGDLEAPWQKLLKTTTFFMGVQVRDIVAKKVYVKNLNPTQTPR